MPSLHKLSVCALLLCLNHLFRKVSELFLRSGAAQKLSKLQSSLGDGLDVETAECVRFAVAIASRSRRSRITSLTTRLTLLLESFPRFGVLLTILFLAILITSFNHD